LDDAVVKGNVVSESVVSEKADDFGGNDDAEQTLMGFNAGMNVMQVT
jgi:hypothetical protein